MRKQVDIQDDLLKDLKIVAAHADKSVKKWLEDLIANAIREQAKKLKK